MKKNEKLKNIIQEICELKDDNPKHIQKIFRKYPNGSKGLFKKSLVLKAYNNYSSKKTIKLTKDQEENFLRRIRLKTIRTISGVTPVTVLTKPYPCPGQCIFCPSDVRMPKSYLKDEPGAQRAYKHKFDPYQQTYNRLLTFKEIGHPTDKVELIILGGTWTSYPKTYQIWFVKRCFDALNDFTKDKNQNVLHNIKSFPLTEDKFERINGKKLQKTYNEVISKVLSSTSSTKRETATWEELFKVHKINESAQTRCIGLVIETRPDEITKEEVIHIRKLGATKVQIGVQSLDNKVLKLNKRGHDVTATRKAFKLLRQAGFKIHIHWMPNLYGSTPQMDIVDYKKLFKDENFRPDEIKIYPCSLISSAELMQYYQKGLWKPYTEKELMQILKECIKSTPSYCRITRIIRDISSDDIVTGNKKTNFRQIVEKELKNEGFKPVEIRNREIKGQEVNEKDLKLNITKYQTSVSEEMFLEYVTKDNRIAGFLRLSLPYKKQTTHKAENPLTHKHFIPELQGSAIIREVHVYGPSLEIGIKSKNKPQHLGLGKNLIYKAKQISKQKEYKKLAVISAIGTRKYYEDLGFKNSDLYLLQNTR